MIVDTGLSGYLPSFSATNIKVVYLAFIYAKNDKPTNVSQLHYQLYLVVPKDGDTGKRGITEERNTGTTE